MSYPINQLSLERTVSNALQCRNTAVIVSIATISNPFEYIAVYKEI